MKFTISKKFLIYVGLFYCALIWGFTFIVTKWALEGSNPVVMVSIRFFLSAIMLLPFVLKKGLYRYIKEGLILSIFLSLLYITQTVGLVYTTASNSGFITGLFIIFIPLFSYFFYSIKISTTELISSIFAITGMWFLTGGMKEINIGDLLTLVAACSYSIHLLITDRYVKKNYDIIQLAFQQFWMVGLISFVYSYIAGYNYSVSSIKSFWWIVFLAFFPTITAFFIQMRAQKEIEPFKVGIIFCFEPIFAAIFAWTLGGEDFVLNKAFGGFLIVMAMFINEMGKFEIIKYLNLKEKLFSS
ncbi:MAG: DMT family transporter [Endomicrobia bacterium]|nr:DMT family transporter [Endomicrobiia bacterium]